MRSRAEVSRDVRFGSKADICAAIRHVRFTPDYDRESGFPHEVMSALPRKRTFDLPALTNLADDRALPDHGSASNTFRAASMIGSS